MTSATGAPDARLSLGPELTRLAAPRTWILLACVLVAVIGVYSPVAGGPFIWDDHHLVLDSPQVRELRPLLSYFESGFWVDDAMTANNRNYYRPITILSLALDHHFYGDNSGGFHLTNLAVHLTNTWLLFALLRRRGTSGAGAALGAALWGVFPRLTEDAAWIAGRTDALATLFVLFALLANTSKSWLWRSLAGVLILLGLLSKEVALAGALALLAEELLVRRDRPLSRRVFSTAPVVLALGAYALLRVWAVGRGVRASAPLLARALASLEALGRYTWMLFDGWHPDAQLGRLGLPERRFVILGILAVLFLAYLAFRAWRKNASLAELTPIVLGSVALFLVLHLIPITIDVVVADRFMYLPLAAFVLAVTPSLDRYIGARPRLAVVPLALCLSYIPAAYARASQWSDEVRFWATHYAQHPNDNTRACIEFGNLYYRAGMFKRALRLYAHADGRNYYSALAARKNAANSLTLMGKYNEARSIISELVQREPGIPSYLYSMALQDTYALDFESAQKRLKRALWIYPGYDDARQLLHRLPEIARDQAVLRAPAADKEGRLAQARMLIKMGRRKDGLLIWRAAADSAELNLAEWDEFMWYVLQHGDSGLVNWAFAHYRAAVPRVDPRLALVYETRVEAEKKLRAAWSELHLSE